MVDTTDEWIMQRVGIRERHIVDPGVATSDLAREASLKAIERAGLTPADIDFIVVGTTTPDTLFPSTACVLQDMIGAKHAWGYDLVAACSGFIYALTTGAQMVASGASRHALVVGADVMSSIIDYTDRTTCVLFGDGAGACVVEASDDDEVGIIDFENYVDGSGGPALCMPAGGSRLPASKDTIEKRLHYVKQDGADRLQVRGAQLRRGVPADPRPQRHQAGRHRLVRAAPGQQPHHPGGGGEARPRAGEGRHQSRSVRQHHRGTIPLALNDALESGRLKRGDLVLMAAVGAGFTVGAMLLRWGLKDSPRA